MSFKEKSLWMTITIAHHELKIHLSAQSQYMTFLPGVSVRSNFLLVYCSTLLSLSFDMQLDHFQEKYFDPTAWIEGL